MNYFSKVIATTFDEAIKRVTEELKKEGFGILTEIDVKDTLKKKLDVDFKKYKILGACNPPFAFKALTTDERVGLLLPCNVVIQEMIGDKIEVTAIDPVSMLEIMDNPELEPIAKEIRGKLERAIESL
jgi:uncharacterized protein (DUF302 family)